MATSRYQKDGGDEDMILNHDLAILYKFLAQLTDEDVFTEGADLRYPPHRIKEECERFEATQRNYFEHEGEKVRRKYMAAIAEMQWIVKREIQRIEQEAA